MAARKVLAPPARSSEPTPKLTEEAKVYVVTSMALWKTPTEILKVLAEEFGTPISTPALYNYDPRNPNCPERWKDLHAATRKAYVEGVANLAGSSKAWRIDQLLGLHERAKAAGNLVLAAALLKQIAEDHGDVYTKVRELTGPGGTPLAGNVVTIDAGSLLAGLRGETAAPPVAAPALEPPE